MPDMAVRLKVLLRQKRWLSYGTFTREYDRAAREEDPKLVGGGPSRAQLHRWLSGDLKNLPYPHHCAVLQRMFPEWSAEQLFQLVPEEIPEPLPRIATDAAEAALNANVRATVAASMATPGSAPTTWGPPHGDRLSGAAPTRQALVAPPQFTPHPSDEPEDLAQVIARRLLLLGQVRRMPAQDVQQLASLMGQLVELDMRIDLDIDKDGDTRITYRRTLLNLSDRPLNRLPLEMWFKYTSGRLGITPINEGEHRIAIQRQHDIGNLVKFACQITPPVEPGNTAQVGHVCTGGLFKDALYWRHQFDRYTRFFTMSIRHRGAGLLAGCQAVESHPDGTETITPAALTWDYDGDDVLMTATFDYLRPTQSVTIRWELDRESA